jgi:Transposase C of IS166 homeodomain
MSLVTADLPSDPEALRAFAAACQAELAATTAELKAAQLSVQLRTLEIEKLKFQIAKLRRVQFGRSSEKVTRQIEQLGHLRNITARAKRRRQQRVLLLSAPATATLRSRNDDRMAHAALLSVRLSTVLAAPIPQAS